MYNKYKTAYYTNILKTVSKKYKNTLAKTNRNYRANKIKELRSLKKSDRRKYWKTINSQVKNDNNSASLNDLYIFFSKTQVIKQPVQQVILNMFPIFQMMKIMS